MKTTIACKDRFSILLAPTLEESCAGVADNNHRGFQLVLMARRARVVFPMIVKFNEVKRGSENGYFTFGGTILIGMSSGRARQVNGSIGALQNWLEFPNCGNETFDITECFKLE